MYASHLFMTHYLVKIHFNYINNKLLIQLQVYCIYIYLLITHNANKYNVL